MYLSAATLHQTPNLPQRKGKASVLQSKTETVSILSSRFVTVRTVVGAQLSAPRSLSLESSPNARECFTAVV
jgi:hypothetical protein